MIYGQREGVRKPLDTDQYCIIAGDGLINQAIKDGHTVTTGPASIDPDTGKPYGMRFPILTMRDLVNAQKALVDSLGIQKLRAVMGLSMGGAQSFEWATVFPDSTDRVIPIVMGVETDGYFIGSTDNWRRPSSSIRSGTKVTITGEPSRSMASRRHSKCWFTRRRTTGVYRRRLTGSGHRRAETRPRVGITSLWLNSPRTTLEGSLHKSAMQTRSFIRSR